MAELCGVWRLFTILMFILCIDKPCSALRLRDIWDAERGYAFLARFGFQKTQVDEKRATRGYIFGNVTSVNIDKGPSTLVVLDGDYIMDIHGNATAPWYMLDQSFFSNISGRNPSDYEVEKARCNTMFARLNKVAWHKTCSPYAKMDFFRTIPCAKDHLCDEEDDPGRVVKGYQFTYTIQDTAQPRFWYMALIACVRNATTCQWEPTGVTGTSEPSLINFDIWMVNGDPALKDYNKFEHQFSFEDHELLEVNLSFFLFFLILALVVHRKLGSAKEPFSFLLLSHLWLSVAWTMLQTIDYCVFATNGRGLPHVTDFSQLVACWGDSFFLMLILATAEHWFSDPFGVVYAVIQAWRIQQGHKSINFCLRPDHLRYFAPILSLFLFAQTCLYTWALLEHDPVDNVLVWNTVAGCVLLALRFCVIFWFLAILRQREATSSMLNKHASLTDLAYSRPDRLCREAPMNTTVNTRVEFVYFASGYLLWLMTLPMIVFIAQSNVSALWRKKTIRILTLCCDYTAAVVFSYLTIGTRNAVLEAP